MRTRISRTHRRTWIPRHMVTRTFRTHRRTRTSRTHRNRTSMISRIQRNQDIRKLNLLTMQTSKIWSSQNIPIQTSSRESYPVASRTGQIALVPAHLNNPLEYSGYRGELGYSKQQMLPKLETGEAGLYRQLFIYLKLLKITRKDSILWLLN